MLAPFKAPEKGNLPKSDRFGSRSSLYGVTNKSLDITFRRTNNPSVWPAPHCAKSPAAFSHQLITAIRMRQDFLTKEAGLRNSAEPLFGFGWKLCRLLAGLHPKESPLFQNNPTKLQNRFIDLRKRIYEVALFLLIRTQSRHDNISQASIGPTWFCRKELPENLDFGEMDLEVQPCRGV